MATVSPAPIPPPADHPQRRASLAPPSPHNRKAHAQTHAAFPLLIAILLLCVLGVMLYLRAKAPPEAARLLPESDAIIFLNLKPVRAATHFDKNSPSSAAPTSSTSSARLRHPRPERDLDSTSLLRASTTCPAPTSPNGPVAFSEVFVGRFDGVRLAQYLHSIASAEELLAPAAPSTPFPSTAASSASPSSATTSSPPPTCPPPSRSTPCQTAIP